MPSIGGHGGFTAKGDTFLAGTAQGGLLTFDIGSANFRAYDPPEEETQAATFAAASPAHGIVATAHTGPFVKIWKTSDNKHFKTLKPNGADCVWLDFSKDGALLVAACGDSATIWNAEDWSEVKRLDIPDCRRVFFDQTGKRVIALQDKQQRVSVWDIESATEIAAIANPEAGQGVWQALAVSPGDAVMAIASGSTIYLYRSADGQLLRTLSGHTGTVSDLVFRPDGLVLASVAGDKTVQLWSTPEEGANIPPAEKFELPKPPMRRAPRNRSS
jgi:WD40 repeat protein